MHDFELGPRVFPSRVADLGFIVELPRDWTSHSLPEPTKLEFSDPTVFAPLAVVTAPHAALIFTVAARPAYGDGTVHEWASYLLSINSLTPRALGDHRVGATPAIVGEAVQDSELGPMVVRFAFCEDGRRLLNITLSAPAPLASAMRNVWFSALASFTLTKSRGSSVPLYPVADPVPAQVAGPVERVNVLADDTPLLAAVDAAVSPVLDDWWARAQALEREDRLAEAEEVITGAIDHIASAATIARLYASRARRLQALGDDGKSREAHRQAVQWIQYYASLATSGSEGAARSTERDRFLRELGETP